MADLREELAQRLWRIELGPDPDGEPPWYGATGPARKAMRRLADEVIRQMEWARSRCISVVAPISAVAEQELIESDSFLTLAPPDWKP